MIKQELRIIIQDVNKYEQVRLSNVPVPNEVISQKVRANLFIYNQPLAEWLRRNEIGFSVVRRGIIVNTFGFKHWGWIDVPETEL